MHLLAVFNKSFNKTTLITLQGIPRIGDTVEVHHVREKVTDVIWATPMTLRDAGITNSKTAALIVTE